MCAIQDLLVIDGSHGEGGGQILRTGLSLGALLGRPVRFKHIRAGRRRPGLAAQHLTAVRAAAALCSATVEGDALGSQDLVFAPRQAVRPGCYEFDVGAARVGGSAGGTSLVLQTVFLPLALTAGYSVVTIHGGTHLPQSPPFDYLRDVWLPMMHKLGINASIALAAWGWFPVGRGKIRAEIAGAPPNAGGLGCLDLQRPGQLVRVTGRAVAGNLPAHIPQRMVSHASSLLSGLGCDLDLVPQTVTAACPGAGIFLTAEYENVRAGFSAFGARGKPSGQVAKEVMQELLHHHASGASVDRHLADQMLLPLAFAAGPSRFTTPEVTRHLETNAWVIAEFGLARTSTERTGNGAAQVTVTPLTA